MGDEQGSTRGLGAIDEVNREEAAPAQEIQHRVSAGRLPGGLGTAAGELDRGRVVVLEDLVETRVLDLRNLFQQARAPIPAQHCVVILRRPDFFRGLEMFHGLVKMGDHAIRRAASAHLRLSGTLT